MIVLASSRVSVGSSLVSCVGHDAFIPSSSVRVYSSYDFCSDGLVVMNSLSLGLFGNIIIPLLILRCNVIGYSNLSWYLHTFNIWITLFQCFLAFGFTGRIYSLYLSCLFFS